MMASKNHSFYYNKSRTFFDFGISHKLLFHKHIFRPKKITVVGTHNATREYELQHNFAVHQKKQACHKGRTIQLK